MLENRPQRDISAIRGKFDRLANTKKPTGDPSCPPAVRRAKLIARDMLGKVNAFSVGDVSDDDTDSKDGSPGRDDEDGGDVPGSECGNKRAGGEPVGTRKRQSKEGVGGVKVSSSEPEEDEMLEHMGVMAKRVSSLVEVFQEETDGVSPSLQSAILETFKE